ncbi:MAG: hypothetical protein NTX24_02345 [Candidatus Pacearchaeota archaeon]|nr:hypothetical protein [Candidatus Pacearchaeota archaeon]
MTLAKGMAQERRDRRNKTLSMAGLASLVSVAGLAVAFGAFKCEQANQREIQGELHNTVAAETCKVSPASLAFQRGQYGITYRLASSALYHMADKRDDYAESGDVAAARDQLWGETADTLTTLKIASAARIRAAGEDPRQYWAAP